MADNPARGARPRLAVLIPVFDRQRGLEQTLHSLRRDGAPFDVVVVDDGSEPPIRVPDDPPFRVELIRLPRNRGIVGALNAGLERIEAMGYEYVARLDADDVSLPGRFAAQMAFLGRHPDHAVIGTQVEWVDPDGRLLFSSRFPTRHEQLIRFNRYQSGLAHPSVMMRMEALAKSGLYREGYPGAEDYELFMRLTKEHKLGNLDEVYLRMEMSPHSLSARKFRLGMGRILVLMKYFEPFSIHSYLGIARSVVLLFVPRRITLGLRRAQARWGPARRCAGPKAGPESG